MCSAVYIREEHEEERSDVTTRTMTMSMTEDGDRGIAPPKPLFESSWLALFFLLKQELEALRDEGPVPGERGPDEGSRAEACRRPN